MNSFDVVTTDRAKADLRTMVAWWSENHSQQEAEAWYDAISAAIRSLSFMPHRCSRAYGIDVEPAIRILRFGIGAKPTHRIYFGIYGQEVIVFRVRSMRQREFRDESDLMKQAPPAVAPRGEADFCQPSAI